MQLLYALAELRTPFLDALLGALTNCGGELVFMAAAIIVFWCVSKSCGYYMLTVGFVGTIVNQFLKLVFRIPRPWVKDPDFQIVESARAEATGYSFPSGHTQNVFASFGCLGRWTKRTWLRVVCALLIVVTAFSRMYLGVHTPLDVGVSFGIGLVLVFALYPLFRDIDSHPNRLYLLFGAMAVLGAAYLLFAELWPFPADVDAANLASGRKNAYTLLGAVLGMTFAYWLDRRYVHFDVRHYDRAARRAQSAAARAVRRAQCCQSHPLRAHGDLCRRYLADDLRLVRSSRAEETCVRRVRLN